jgi:hypothetical protein
MRIRPLQASTLPRISDMLLLIKVRLVPIELVTSLIKFMSNFSWISVTGEAIKVFLQLLDSLLLNVYTIYGS